MPLTVRQFPCLADNYGFLIRDEASGKTGCIDTPDAPAILAELDKAGWKLDMILNTHWHPDHAGGNAQIQAATGCTIVGPAEVTRIAPLDRTVAHGDTVDLGETRFQVIDTGGHTLGHITYFDSADRIAFVGDTLFALGCGRLFEGTAQQMWTSLQRLAALPDETTVYCAHEYTASNARFALSVDEAPALKARAAAVFAARERGEPTVPTTIALEKATNPFLRAPALAARVGKAGAPDYEAFGAVRAAKDGFRG
jgi:hydroxyacylglutathione hydrolase